VTFTPATGILAGTPAAGTSGSYPVTFTASNGVGSNATQSFTLAVNTAPAITSANNTTFAVGTAGTFTVTATGTPTPTLSVTGALPTGVTFTPATGILAGTPAAGTGGTYPITITAQNGVAPAATQSFTLTVNQTSAITSANITTFTVGTAGTFTVTATGTPAPTLSVTGTLPTGVTFTPATGKLAGTPAAGTSGSYPITFTASNGVGSNATQSFTLTVNQAPAITSANSTTFAVGTAGTFTVTATGSPAPTVSVTGALPAGVTFTPATKILAGTPAAGTGGSYPITFTASNGVGSNATQTFTLTVNTAPVITSANSTTFALGTAGTFTVTATGTPTPTLSVTGTLPTGVTFTPATGILAGTPGAGTSGSYPITITAQNGVAPVATQSFTLIVNSVGVTLNNANSPLAAFNSSTFSKPMTVTPGGSNTVAFATVWVDEGSGTAGTTFNVTATYGGQAMTSAGATSYDYDYSPMSSQVFYLVNPPTGTNTLVINATASSGTIQEVVANLVSYNGVNQTTPVRPGSYQTLNTVNGATVGSFTATIASNTNDLTLGAVEATFTFASPASNQTVDGTSAAYFKVGSDHATVAAASVNDTWSFTNPWAYYAYVGFSIQAASGNGTPTLTYTANPAGRSFGAANPAFTGTVTGFIGSDTQANATTGTLAFTSTATAASNVGSYAITGSGLTANNGKYTFAQAGSNSTALTVTKATPTITVTGGTFAYDGNFHPATATAVGIDGITPVSGSFGITYTPPGNSTVPINAGTYSVTATFTSTDPNYSNATGTGSITITSSGAPTVTLNNANAPIASFGSSSFSKPMTVAAGGSNTVAFATVWVDEGSGPSGTTFNVTATYGGQAMTSAGATSYDYDYAPMSTQVFYLVNPPTGTNTLVITATASSGTIQEIVANLVSYNGVNQTTPVRPGTYQTLHTVNGATVGSFTATLSSSATDLTLGAVEATFTFASPASNQTVDGTSAAYFKVGSDHASVGSASVSDTWSFTNPWAFYTYVGFSIQASGVPVLTYTATPTSRVFGTANPTFTGTVTGFIGTDTLANSTTGTLTFTSPATTSSSVGSYAISGSGLTANNGKYTFAQAPSNSTALTITPAGCSGGSPSYYQYVLNDFSSAPSAQFSLPTKNCDMIVVYGSTQLNTASFTGVPTVSDGTPLPQCVPAACNVTTTNSSMNTRIWTGISTGGTTPTYNFNMNSPGQTIGGVAVELSGVTTLDQIASSQLLSSTATSITSPSITTTHPNEILLCLASEANPIAGGAHFIGVNSPWTLITFGNQAIGYILAPTIGTYTCTVTRAAGTQDETIAIASFY
jgi:hypothetical protein